MPNLTRRTFVAALPVALASCLGGAEESRASDLAKNARGAGATEMIVHRSPSCGCCGAWVDHLRAHGFAVQVVEVADTGSIARQLGVPDALRSCHTAEVGHYAIEGHVPAGDIRRLLAARPAVAGLAVPGMPIGSPGMEAGGRSEPYQVIAFENDGATSVFASYE